MPLVAKRYAEALADIAFAKGAAGQFREDLADMTGLIDSTEGFREYLRNPGIPRQAKKKLLKDISGEGCSGEVAALLQLLIDNERIDQFDDIRIEYEKIADAREKVLNVTLYSALPLSPADIERLAGIYKNRFGASSVNVSCVLDKELIGGIKVKIGDRVIDGSIKGRLEELSRLFNIS